MTHCLGDWKKTVTVTVLGGDGLPKKVTVVVSNNATDKEIQEAAERKARNE